LTELADVFCDAGPAYVQRFGDRLLPSHWQVLRDVVDCRTPVLGGRMFLCHDCGHEHSVYHSCRNRHCPKCQGGDAEQWLERQRDILLPCEYGLATCTLPAGLRDIARSHQRTVYSILMREAAHALLELAADRLFIGGLVGIMAVLHTWTRTLIFHPHVHMLFPVGGLADGGDSWIKPRKRTYILPAYALAKRFRERTELAFRKAGLYDLVPREVWCKPWVANVKRVGTGETALLYLSRYVATQSTPRSSSGDFCSMFCLGTSSRSATTASGPRPVAKNSPQPAPSSITTSPRLANLHGFVWPSTRMRHLIFGARRAAFPT